jgi:hypothetical protein
MADNLVVALTVDQFKSTLSELIKKELKEHLPIPVKFLNAKESAEFLRCSIPTLKWNVKNGKLPKHKMNAKVLYKQSDLENLAVLLKAKTKKS